MGITEGFPDGTAEGSADGLADGFAVNVGADDGGAVSLFDGASGEGRNVGAAVV